MSEHDLESDESDIDENDPLAPQLHYIRMQKKLKKIDNKMNPWIDYAKRGAPFLRILEKSFKYILIFGVIGTLFYMNMDQLSDMNKKMSSKYSKTDLNSNADEWDIDNEDPGFGWYFSMIQEIIGEHFSWFVIQEMGFHIGLFIFGFGGFAILSYYNNKHDQMVAEIQQKEEEEAKLKEKKNSAKSKFKPKLD